MKKKGVIVGWFFFVVMNLGGVFLEGGVEIRWWGMEGLPQVSFSSSCS